MTQTQSRCYHCRRSTATEVLGPVSGAAAQFTMTVLGLPVQTCESGHRNFAHSKVALQRLLRLTEEGEASLPVSRERGRLFKHAACADCGGKLERAARRKTFHVEMHLTDAAAFGIDLTSPVYRCRACGKEHLSHKELRGLAPAALVDALRSAGIGSEVAATEAKA